MRTNENWLASRLRVRLGNAKRLNPERYSWKEDEVALVVVKYMTAIKAGSFDLASPCLKVALADCGVKSTKADVFEFLSGGA